jgi:hypothetical protein
MCGAFHPLSTVGLIFLILSSDTGENDPKSAPQSELVALMVGERVA